MQRAPCLLGLAGLDRGGMAEGFALDQISGPFPRRASSYRVVPRCPPSGSPLGLGPITQRLSAELEVTQGPKRRLKKLTATPRPNHQHTASHAVGFSIVIVVVIDGGRSSRRSSRYASWGGERCPAAQRAPDAARGGRGGGQEGVLDVWRGS